MHGLILPGGHLTPSSFRGQQNKRLGPLQCTQRLQVSKGSKEILMDNAISFSAHPPASPHPIGKQNVFGELEPRMMKLVPPQTASTRKEGIVVDDLDFNITMALRLGQHLNLGRNNTHHFIRSIRSMNPLTTIHQAATFCITGG